MKNQNKMPAGPSGNLAWNEYIFFTLLYFIVFLPSSVQIVVLVLLALTLLIRHKPQLDRFTTLMFAWCAVYLVSILVNVLFRHPAQERVTGALFTWGLNIGAILFYIHYRNLNLNLTRVGRSAFHNLCILTVLAGIYLLIPSSRHWVLFGRRMANIDILYGSVYGYRFLGFFPSSYFVVFFIFFNFPLSVYYVEKRFHRLAQLVYTFLLLVVVLAVGSRAGIVLYGILGLIYLVSGFSRELTGFLTRKQGSKTSNWKQRILRFLVILLGIVVAGTFAWWMIGLRPTSNSGRIDLYRASFHRVIETSPWLGMGVNDIRNGQTGEIYGSHSAYLSVLYRTGIIGLAIFAAAIVLRLLDLFRDRKINRQRIVYITAILETFLLMIIEDIDQVPWTICFFYIMMAILDRISQPIETLAIKPSLNIAMLGHKHVRYREGGVEVVVSELSTRMVKRGHHVVVYDRGGHHISGKGYDEKKKSDYHGVIVKQVPTVNKKGLAAFSAAFFAAVEASFSRADVVHFHAEGPCIMMWLPKLFGKCCVCTIHGIDWQRAKWSGAGRKVILAGERCAVHQADEIIVLSKATRDYFWNTYHRRTVLIPNGVSAEVKEPAKKITELYGLQGNDYFLFLGRIVPEKGVHYLIEAFEKLDTDKKLVIAGGSSDTDSYYSMIRNKAKEDPRIIFTGFVQGHILAELYSNAYVYVLPSDLEGMPLTILEAMSYGNCCLVSDIPECTEVVEDKGVVFPHGNVSALQKAMQNLVDDPEKVQRFRNEAAAFVLTKYSWDQITDQTLQVYRGTLSQIAEDQNLEVL